jgi:hypothetical protein
MNKAISQVSGIIRYEMLMQWRRRTLVVLCGFFLVGLIGLAAMIGDFSFVSNGQARVLSMGVDENGITRTVTSDDPNAPLQADNDAERELLLTMNDPRSRATWQMLMIFSPGVLVLLVAIPPLLAEVIPLDHQYKVASLLNTTPLSRARYLIGKLLSVWLGLVIGLSIAAIVYGFYMMTVHGAIDVWTYVRYWVVMALLPALLLAGFAVVVPALVRSRRAGVLIGIGMIPLALYLAAMTLGSGYVLPILFRAAALAQQGIESAFDTAFNDTLLNTISTQIPFALVLFGVGMGVWAILRAKEATS